MKLILSMIFVLAAIGQITDCNKEHSINKEFELKYGQTIDVKEENLKIKFSSVLEDSRCPQGEQCIRAGNGKIALEITGTNDKRLTINLNTSDEPQEYVFQDFVVRLIELKPYPQAGVEIKKDDYVATVKIQNQNPT